MPRGIGPFDDHVSNRFVGRPHRPRIDPAAAACRALEQPDKGRKFNIGITGQKPFEAEYQMVPTIVALRIYADGLMREGFQRGRG